MIACKVQSSMIQSRIGSWGWTLDIGQFIKMITNKQIFNIYEGSQQNTNQCS